jgi:hypothetical protein
MSVKYRIGYYQVNIGVGDSEIVLLIKETTSSPPTEEILKAVLIDGGDLPPGDTYQLQNIKHVMKNIETEFKLKDGLKFDVVVITHWDEDHYKGVLEMMFYDMQLQEPDGEKDPRKRPDPTADGYDGDPLQASFLKYDRGNPVSMLYIPNRRDQGSYDVEYSATEGFKFWAKRFKRVCKVTLDQDRKINDPLDPDFTKYLRSSPSMKTPTRPPTADNKIIGRELFSGDYVDAARTARSPTELITAYQTSGTTYKGDTPGLFCIMANNRHLPPAKSLTDEVKASKTTIVNRSSIGCLIIWPNGNVSHYFAGDLDADQEAKMIDWTGLERPRPTDPARPKVEDTVPIVKGSHHGSAESFPLHLCQVFKPSVILFSAGDGHKHPCNPKHFLLSVR